MDSNTPFWIEGIATVVLGAGAAIGGMKWVGKMEQRVEHVEEAQAKMGQDMEGKATKAEFHQIMDRLDELKEDMREVRDWARNGKKDHE